MQRIKTTLAGLITVTFAVVAFAPSAHAQFGTLDANTLGAAVVVPWEARSASPTLFPNQGQITVATVTNGLTSEAITVHVVVFDENWQAHDWTCPLTPLETTYFIFDRDSATGQVKVTYECSDLGTIGPIPSQTNNVLTNFPPSFSDRGVMFISIECQLGSLGCPGGVLGLRTRSDNALLADSTVINMANGWAYSVNAIHIQSTGAFILIG